MAEEEEGGGGDGDGEFSLTKRRIYEEERDGFGSGIDKKIWRRKEGRGDGWARLLYFFFFFSPFFFIVKLGCVTCVRGEVRR